MHAGSPIPAQGETKEALPGVRSGAHTHAGGWRGGVSRDGGDARVGDGPAGDVPAPDGRAFAVVGQAGHEYDGPAPGRQVTKLEARGRFHAARVYLDGEAAFCLYRKECSRYGIEEGSVISEAVYREILDDVLYPRARERMCWLLGRKDYTREQMRRKLEQGGYPEAVIGRALAYACEQRFLDDDRYVEHYLDAFRGAKSRRALLSGLMEKGIPKARAASALEDAAVEEEPQIRAFLEKRRFFSEETDEKAKQKCVAALLRKGYSWEAVRSVARGAMPDVCDM